MNIAIIGSGGREHAFCQKIRQSKLTKNLYCLPGNGGTAKIAKNIDININNFGSVYKFIKKNKINLVIVGPEEPLVNGIVDYLLKRKIDVFGPSKKASQLEGSKIYVKKLCKVKKIPTAQFKICHNLKQVKKFIKLFKLPMVVKVDGLASGKGVFICKTYDEVIKNSEKIFKGNFKNSKKLILEEFLEGEEMSFFLIVDKKTFKFFGSAQDHKRVGENETGPNTGGMGAYSPSLLLNKKIKKNIINNIVKPTLDYLRTKKIFYKGILYVGLIIKNNKPYLVEYNVRMGDPECQSILPLIKSDLVNICISVIKNRLSRQKIIWHKKKSMTIVLCSKGYPGKIKKNMEIKNLNKIKENNNNFIFHSGTKVIRNKYFNTGGRVLNIVSIGKNFSSIKRSILVKLKKINWKDGFYRKDIGWRIWSR